MIVLVNYGVGNLDSILRAFRASGGTASVASRVEDLERADGIVLPGVGSFGKAMAHLRESGLLPVLERKALEEGVPTLGICLGMQMFTKHSEEGGVDGLGWIDGETRRFDFRELEPPPKVPQLGWNDVARRKESPLFEGVHPDACFYFAHSYCVFCEDASVVLATTRYGCEYVSAVQRGNLFGTQFHPEKSHAAGLKVVENFTRYVERA